MNIPFTKMHGLGNDFIVIDGIHQSIQLSPSEIAAMAKRDTGIGFDQCLIIEPSTKEGIDFNYRIFNADGQEVGQCGNGARCLALFVKQYTLSSKNPIRVATKTTEMDLYIHPDHSIRVDMGKPKLAPKDIPFLAPHQEKEYSLTLPNKQIKVHALSVGNPHAVLVVKDIATAPLSSLGLQISQHERFPEQTNAGFMQIISPEHIALRVYERGTGETKACGSGAVAAVAIGRLYYKLREEVKVSLPGGDLVVQWPHLEQSIFLTGPASMVYEGIYFNEGGHATRAHLL